MKKTGKKYNRKISLPYGGVQEVARMAGVSVFTVGNVLKGKSNNTNVLKAIRDYWTEIETLKVEIAEKSTN